MDLCRCSDNSNQDGTLLLLWATGFDLAVLWATDSAFGGALGDRLLWAPVLWATGCSGRPTPLLAVALGLADAATTIALHFGRRCNNLGLRLWATDSAFGGRARVGDRRLVIMADTRGAAASAARLPWSPANKKARI